MKAKWSALLVAVAFLSGSACSDEITGLQDPGDYIVFGDFYGECIGSGCVDIFRIADGELYKDTLDEYPTASKLPHAVDFVELPDDHVGQIESLLGKIPAKLFEETDVVIGQPDAGDWGGFYLETNISGEVRYWLIDKMKDNLPAYLREYADKLEKAIQLAG